MITYQEYQNLKDKKNRGEALNPKEFLDMWRFEKATKTEVRSKKALNSDKELYEVFMNDERAWRSANQFKLAVGRAGLSISHGRAAKLYPAYLERKEQNEQANN
jgi:hypothetical protein